MYLHDINYYYVCAAIREVLLVLSLYHPKVKSMKHVVTIREAPCAPRAPLHAKKQTARYRSWYQNRQFQSASFPVPIIPVLDDPHSTGFAKPHPTITNTTSIGGCEPSPAALSSKRTVHARHRWLEHHSDFDRAAQRRLHATDRVESFESASVASVAMFSVTQEECCTTSLAVGARRPRG